MALTSVSAASKLLGNTDQGLTQWSWVPVSFCLMEPSLAFCHYGSLAENVGSTVLGSTPFNVDLPELYWKFWISPGRGFSFCLGDVGK